MSVREKEGVIKFDPALVQYELSDKAKEIMKTFADNIFIIEKVAESKESYDSFLTTLLTNMHYGFEHEEFRNCLVKYKFRNDKKEDIKWMPYRNFIVNAIFWYPQVILEPEKLDDSFIMPESAFIQMNAKIQKKYFDEWYIKKYRRRDDLSGILHDCTQYLRQISRRFNPFMGLSMNVNVFIDLEKRMPEYGELMRFHVDESKQPAEIERDIAEASKRQVELILNDTKFNTLKAVIQPNALKLKQLSEVHTLIGLKPDDQQRTIPRPINTNYIMGGLHDLFDLYIEAVSGRTAAIINKTLMGVAGHLLILTATMAASAKLDPVESDCGSPNLVPIHITSKKVLEKINMRKYKRPGQKEFKTIDSDVDDELIGETIWMRSPVTCACKNGRICKECYGDLWYRNRDLNSAGLYAGFIVMNPVAQGLLSAKHHQGTNSDMIVFNEGFDKYFVVDSTDIVIRNDIEDVESYKLIVRVEDICTANDDDDDSDSIESITAKSKRGRKKQSDDDSEDESFGLNYFTKKFYVAQYYGNKKLQTIEEFSDVDQKELYMHTDFINKMIPMEDPELGAILTVDLDDIDVSEFVFAIELENNGVVKPLKEIEKLISNKTHEGCDTYEDMVNKMIELLIEAGISAASVHGEMIVRQLIRRSDNKLKRPDFGKIVMRQDYEIMTVNTALKYSPSLSTSLNTAFLKYQLIAMCETDEKTDTSDFDPIFMRTLNLDEMVRHSGGRIDVD